MWKQLGVWSLVVVVSQGLASADEPAIRLKANDRIVFLGDSITQGGAGPNGYVTMIRQDLEKRHADLKLEVIGAGISGNKVPNLQQRVDKDVIAKKPTIVVIYIGINDVWHGENDPSKGTMPDAFISGLKEVIGKCRDAGATVVLCTPSVIGEKHDGSNKLDSKLDQYSDLSRKLAKELSLPLCDLRKAFIEHVKANNKENAAKGILTTDGVHLNQAGNRFVADTMLNVLDSK